MIKFMAALLFLLSSLQASGLNPIERPTTQEDKVIESVIIKSLEGVIIKIKKEQEDNFKLFKEHRKTWLNTVKKDKKFIGFPNYRSYFLFALKGIDKTAFIRKALVFFTDNIPYEGYISSLVICEKYKQDSIKTNKGWAANNYAGLIYEFNSSDDFNKSINQCEKINKNLLKSFDERQLSQDTKRLQSLIDRIWVKHYSDLIFYAREISKANREDNIKMYFRVKGK